MEKQLAGLEAKQKQQQIAIASDTTNPTITITTANTNGKQGVIRGRVSDNVGVAEVLVDGNPVIISDNGSFEHLTFVPATGLIAMVEVTDMAGLSSSKAVSLQRDGNLTSAAITLKS